MDTEEREKGIELANQVLDIVIKATPGNSSLDNEEMAVGSQPIDNDFDPMADYNRNDADDIALVMVERLDVIVSRMDTFLQRQHFELAGYRMMLIATWFILSVIAASAVVIHYLK